MKQQNKISRYLAALQNPQLDKLGVVSEIYSNLSYDELHVFEKRVPRLFHGLIGLNYLKRQSFERVFNSGYQFDKGDDFCEYIGVLAYIFEQHQKELNLFLKLYNEFEQSLLTGKYDDCRKKLNDINTKVSYSFWGADTEIKLSRLTENLAKATNVYNKLFRANRRLSSLCNFSYKTSTVDVPFDTDVEHYLRRMPDQYSREVYISHCFPYKDNKEGRSIYFDTTLSIIDLYCGFIYCLDILSEETIHNEKFVRYLTIISNAIQDKRLRKRLCLITNTISEDIKNGAERQGLIGDYFRGNYDNVVALGEEYLRDNPFDISIMDLYVKSCVITHQDIKEITNDSPLISKIICYYHHYLQTDENSDVYRKKIRNLCEVWYSLPSFKHFYWLVEDRSRNEIANLSMHYWRCSYGLNVQDVAYYQSQDEKICYISQWNSDLAKAFSAETDDILANDQIDFWNYQLFGKSEDNLEELTALIRSNTMPPFSRNSTCSYVINRNFALSRIRDAVELFAEILTEESSHVVLTLNEPLAKDFIESDADRKFDNPLDFAIFYTYVNAAPYKRYLSMKRYLKQMHVEKVSELVVDGSPKVKSLLMHVADRQVLSLQRVFKNSDEVIDERILICKNLYDYYKDKRFLDEASSLSKLQTINGLVQQVDESKIYVDTESIKNKELKDKEFNVLFDIFRNTRDNVTMLENKSPELFAILSLLQKNGNYSFALYSDGESKEIDYKYSLFEKLYLEARNKFVYDPKYGLDYYLSTRIRHGTIDNQLRNHLQEYKLVTNIDESGEYAANIYWIRRLGNGNDCDKILKSFSQKADALIYALKDEWIQIKTEEVDSKPNAVFDFSLSKLSGRINELMLKCGQVDFDVCTALIFDDLWEYTEECLSQMREVLEETHGQMRSLLDELNTRISELPSNTAALNEFKDSVTLCKTQLQTDFQKVQGWFLRKDVSTFDFSILQAFDASLSAINRINQGQLRIHKEINSPSLFNGHYFGAMHDLFHDILKNVLDYQKKRRNVKGEVTAIIREEGDMLNIAISNPIAEQDIPQLQNTIEEANSGYSHLISRGRSRVEGKSGFPKIYNIVCNVFDSIDNKYQNKIENGKFIVEISINISKLRRDEDSNS